MARGCTRTSLSHSRRSRRYSWTVGRRFGHHSFPTAHAEGRPRALELVPVLTHDRRRRMYLPRLLADYGFFLGHRRTHVLGSSALPGLWHGSRVNPCSGALLGGDHATPCGGKVPVRGCCRLAALALPCREL